MGATRSSLTVSLDLHFGHSNRMLAIQTGTARSSSAIPETCRTWRASDNVRLTENLRETLTSNCRIEVRLLQVGTPPYISPNDENTGIWELFFVLPFDLESEPALNRLCC